MSYCLVIYYQRTKAFNAGMLTALTNRMGDVMLLMGVAWWFSAGGGETMGWAWGGGVGTVVSTLKVVGFLVVLAAMTKRTQILDLSDF